MSGKVAKQSVWPRSMTMVSCFAFLETRILKKLVRIPLDWAWQTRHTFNTQHAPSLVLIPHHRLHRKHYLSEPELDALALREGETPRFYKARGLWSRNKLSLA
jgi:hypothetical protein